MALHPRLLHSRPEAREVTPATGPRPLWGSNMEALPFLGAIALALGSAVIIRARRTPRPMFSRVVGGLTVAMGVLLIVLPLVRGSG
jgi:hypothetical protein